MVGIQTSKTKQYKQIQEEIQNKYQEEIQKKCPHITYVVGIPTSKTKYPNKFRKKMRTKNKKKRKKQNKCLLKCGKKTNWQN